MLAMSNLVSWLRRPRLLHSIRNRILLSMLACFALATLAAGSIVINNGHRAVDIEVHASVDFAEQYLRELVRRVGAEARLNDLESIAASDAVNLRHARAFVQTNGGEIRILRTAEPDADGDGGRPPDWFKALMMPEDGNNQARIILVGDGKTVLVVRGDPEDEIAEKWEQLSELALLWLGVIAALAFAFQFVLKWILDPLTSLSAGLTALTAGERAQHVKVPQVIEVADLAQKFNTLAQSLDQVRAENGELYRQIVSVQEEERRHIARELHDEAGPCLFSITTNADSIDRLAAKLDGAAPLLKRRTSEILSAAERIKHMNRALLRRLHPIALGKIAITALIEELLEDIRRRNPNVHIASSLEIESRGFGEAIDLTVYRCIQEALSNAIRHGHAKHIVVHIAESTEHLRDSARRIEVQIRDDGSGLKPGTEFGFGLAAMRERVLAAEGSLKLDSVPGEAGTIICVIIPLSKSGTKPILSDPLISNGYHDQSSRH